MKIYHGTQFEKLDSILRDGIRPRGIKGKTNWKKAPSHPLMVYLSTAYPFYFSHSCLNKKSMRKGLVFEIDFDALEQMFLYPDEDFIWQVLKIKDPNLTLAQVREALFDYRDNWEVCLNKMGTVAYAVPIKPSQITRYCIIDFDKQKEIGWSVLDPTITILNFTFKGQFYKDLVAWIFGDKKTLPQVAEAKDWLENSSDEMRKDNQKRFDFWTKVSKKRDGIEVVEL